MAKFKRFVNTLIPASLLLCSTHSNAVDDSKLWLPSGHVTHFLQLKEAAEAAESLERCTKVLRGTIDFEQSRGDHLIFRILCRQENNKTYNEMVDGQTMETLTTQVVVEDKMSEEELEMLRLEEERRKQEALDLKKLNDWNSCSEALLNDIRLMDSVEWVGDYPPEPDVFNENETSFTIDFDAKNLQGYPLRYRAKCKVSSEEASNHIKKRKDEE